MLMPSSKTQTKPYSRLTGRGTTAATRPTVCFTTTLTQSITPSRGPCRGMPQHVSRHVAGSTTKNYNNMHPWANAPNRSMCSHTTTTAVLQFCFSVMFVCRPIPRGAMNNVAYELFGIRVLGRHWRPGGNRRRTRRRPRFCCVLPHSLFCHTAQT